MDINNDLYLPKGTLFSLAKLEQWLKQWEAHEYPSKLSSFDIKTIKAASLKRYLDPDLKYYKIIKKV